MQLELWQPHPGNQTHGLRMMRISAQELQHVARLRALTTADSRRTASAAERKTQQLWTGSVMLPTFAGLMAEHHVSAFGLRSCSHSVQAAAHLPLKLEATRQTAEEAGVRPPKPEKHGLCASSRCARCAVVRRGPARQVPSK